jgi:glycerol uptake facilitator-like aquaporin
VKVLRPLWVAFRAAVIATAVFWVTILVIENSGWEVSADIAQPLVFFVLFFFGMLLVPRR